MSNEKARDEKPFPVWVIVLLATMGFVLACCVGWWAWSVLVEVNQETGEVNYHWTDLGASGDYLAGWVAAATGLAGTILFFGALLVQRRELRIQHRQLREYREVAAEQKDAMRAQVAQMERQGKYLDTQAEALRDQARTQEVQAELAKEHLGLSKKHAVVFERQADLAGRQLSELKKHYHLIHEEGERQCLLKLVDNMGRLRYEQQPSGFLVTVALNRIVHLANDDKKFGVESIALFAGLCYWVQSQELKLELRRVIERSKLEKTLREEPFIGNHSWEEVAFNTIMQARGEK